MNSFDMIKQIINEKVYYLLDNIFFTNLSLIFRYYYYYYYARQMVLTYLKTITDISHGYLLEYHNKTPQWQSLPKIYTFYMYGFMNLEQE